MKRFIALMLVLLSFQSFAYDAQEVELPQGLNQTEGARFVEEAFEAGRYVLQTSTFVFTKSDKSAQYPAGDFVILWGIGSSTSDQNMTRDEYTRIWRIMNYLSGKGFRVVMNVRAEGADVKDAVETQGTSVVLFSGHGNTSGFYDYNSTRVSYDVFKNKAASVYQFILSACHGTEARDKYAPPADMLMYTWSGLTNSTDLETFLMGSWTGFEGKDLGLRGLNL